MRRVKLMALLVLVVLALIVVFQNTAPVQIQLLFWRPEPPLIVLTLALLVVGFVVGLLVGRRWWKPRKGAASAGEAGAGAAEPTPPAPESPEEPA